MNSIPGREPRADTRDINQPKKPTKRGCYLALTFGTLLSSQGADAHETRPIPWPSFEAASLRYATFRGSQVPGSVTSGIPSRAATPVQPAVLRKHSLDPPDCWAFGTRFDQRAPGCVPVSRSGLAGRREKVTWRARTVSNG